MFAAAPRAKKIPSRVAAVGTETGRLEAFPEKRSMMRPIPKGIERDTVEDTHSYRERNSRNELEFREGDEKVEDTHETDSDSDRFAFRFRQYH
jgi:hypothetical protein